MGIQLYRQNLALIILLTVKPTFAFPKEISGTGHCSVVLHLEVNKISETRTTVLAVRPERQ